jgi:hypothetical protein
MTLGAFFTEHLVTLLPNNVFSLLVEIFANKSEKALAAQFYSGMARWLPLLLDCDTRPEPKH